MPVLKSFVQITPRLLDLVNQILDEVKQPNIASITSAKPPHRAIVNGINDALLDIHTRAKFAFRKAEAAITLAADESDYLVPADFGSLDQDIVIPNGLITFVPISKFIHAASSGSPSFFTMKDGDHITLSPAPNADFVAKLPQIMLTYYRRAAILTKDDDYPNVPLEFIDLLKLRGGMFWKKMNEYSMGDIQFDKAEYEQKMSLKIASYLRAPGMRAGMRGPFMGGSRGSSKGAF